MSAIRLFYSYSINDEKFQEELEKSLTLLQRYDYLEGWNFRRIMPGHNIDATIKDELENSDIVLLLVSRDFLASKYCYDVELKRALELHDDQRTIVIPIIVKECDWKHEKSPLKNLEALPRNGQPIIEWNFIDRAFQDITDGLKKTIGEIKERKSTSSSQVEGIKKKVRSQSQIDGEADVIRKAVEVFLQERERISYNSSIEDVEKFQKLRGELFNSLISGEVDEKIKNTPSLKGKIPHTLFDKIYASEKLDDFTINEIHKIRDDKTTYHWHERKIVVSALTLSLITFKKFDPKKVHLLLDFITDFEDIVAQNALTGLVVGLIYHKNKWERFTDLKRRLEHLRELKNVQLGLWQIERILRKKLYLGTLFDGAIFKAPFFSSPVNCFLPFYKGNPILHSALQNNASNIDPDSFSEYVEKLPFLDSHKYSLCLALEKGTAREVKLSKEERDKVFRSLTLADDYAPYQNILSELYCFVSHYPSDKIDDVFKVQLSITQTKLKSIILDKVHELQLTAENLIQEDNLHEAIRNFIDLLAIEPTNRDALWGVSQCFSRSKKPDFKSAIKYLMILNSLEEEKNINTIVEIAYCNRALDRFEKALEFGLKAKSMDPHNYRAILSVGLTYEKLEDFTKGLEVFLEGSLLYPTDSLFLDQTGEMYDALGEFEKAVSFFHRALEHCDKDDLASIYVHLSASYADLGDSANALKYADLALQNDPKDVSNLMNIGRVYLICNIDFNLAKKYLEKSIAIKKLNVSYGNLGHVELCLGNEEKAVECYKNSAMLFDDIKVFEKKYNKDLPYLIKCGVKSEQYNRIRDVIIEFWHSSRK